MSSILKHILTQGSFWMINKAMVKKCGFTSAAMLSILVDKYYYHQNNETLYCIEWFYCTREQIEKEICLSAHEQRNAELELLKHEFIEIRKMGQPAKNYYRVDQEKIAEFLLALKNA